MSCFPLLLWHPASSPHPVDPLKGPVTTWSSGLELRDFPCLLILVRFTSTILGSFFHGALYLGTQDANSQGKVWLVKMGESRVGWGLHKVFRVSKRQEAGIAIDAEALGQLSIWPSGGGGSGFRICGLKIKSHQHNQTT